MNVGDGLTLYVIFDKPVDHPHKFVLRKQHVYKGGRIEHDPEIILCDTLEEAREKVPSGLNRLDRFPEDVGSLVETWI
ncbi:MAG: hypothetical protein V2I33_16370 [Kangiellaceae bacterium]|jgi:hypothetical protein|nr:hypothetical protein [Kangiellaceae bacterium]